MSQTDEHSQAQSQFPHADEESAQQKKSIEEVGQLIRKPPITTWAHDESQKFVVTKDVFKELSDFLAQVNWNTVAQMKAPANTPDIGFVFTRMRDYAVGRYSTKPSFLRTVENNLSFLVWNSLMTAKKVLNTFNRRRLNWELLGSLLVASMNAAYAAVGGIEGAREAGSGAGEGASAGSGADAEVEVAPPKEKKRKAPSSGTKKASKKVKAESAGDVPQSNAAEGTPATTPTASASQQPIAVQPVSTA